jgi:hypothetical protein
MAGQVFDLKKIKHYADNRVRLWDGGVRNSLLRYVGSALVAGAIVGAFKESPSFGLIAFSVLLTGGLGMKGIGSQGRRGGARGVLRGSANADIRGKSALMTTREEPGGGGRSSAGSA